jgi:hypothetical protein
VRAQRSKWWLVEGVRTELEFRTVGRADAAALRTVRKRAVICILRARGDDLVDVGVEKARVWMLSENLRSEIDLLGRDRRSRTTSAVCGAVGEVR